MKNVIIGMVAGVLIAIAVVEIMEAASLRQQERIRITTQTLQQQAESYESAKDLVHIQRVVYAAIIVEAKYKNTAQRLDAEQNINFSNCPQDFRDAWNAYMQEQWDNYYSIQNKGKEVVGDEMIAVTLCYMGAGVVAEPFADRGLDSAFTPAKTSHTALNRLKGVLLKYKNAVPD